MQSLMGKKGAWKKRNDSRYWALSSSLLFPPSLLLCKIQRQGAGAALSVNGHKIRHVTQQQSQIIKTASPGKWWQLVQDRHGGIASNKRIIEAAPERESALDCLFAA